LLKVKDGSDDVLGRFMQTLEGDFAQAYNIRKKRTGAFWSDRYHAVMIDSGSYLWRCLQYIDLNMVRAGAVRSPREWAWCGYHEITGLRQRYRIVDVEALCEELGFGHPPEQVAKHYVETVEHALRMGTLAREAYWTESLAVGSEDFVRKTGSKIRNRMAVEVEETGDGPWLVRESIAAYGSFSGEKNASKSTFSAKWPA
jgi:putative transposase